MGGEGSVSVCGCDWGCGHMRREVWVCEWEKGGEESIRRFVRGGELCG